MTIYVGNLNYQVRENDLNDLFSEFGEVVSVKIVKDNATGKSKGFAFVEMAESDAADEAIEALHESEFKDRTLVVNKARPKTNDRPERSDRSSNYRSNNGGGNKRFNNNRY